MGNNSSSPEGEIFRGPVREARLIAVALLLALLGISAARAQEESPSEATSSDASSEDRPYWRQNLFGRFFRDQKYLFTTWWPAEFGRTGFTLPVVGGIALATTSTQSSGEGADLELKNYVRRRNQGRGERVARRFSFVGDAGAGATLIGTGYLIGRWSHNDRLAEASSLSAEALLSAGLYSSALKTITGRNRPSGSSQGRFFDYNPGSGE